MITVKIKDLNMRLSNSNLPLTKSEIWFKLMAQKKETDK